MVYISKYGKYSHLPKDKIEEMRRRHHRDLIQPRRDGEINPEYIENYGAKNLNVSRQDVLKMRHKSQRLADFLDRKREEQERNQSR